MKGSIYLFFSVMSTALLAQESLGIGTENPDPSALVHFESTTQGFLFPGYPRSFDPALTGSTPLFAGAGAQDDGLLYYNTSANQLAQYKSSGNYWSDLSPIPSGAIIMWAGEVSNIPAGYVICDGTSGTPDLRGRFIAGYSGEDDYDRVGNTGGQHEVSLSLSQMPVHSHTVSDPGHGHTVTASHRHSVTYDEYAGVKNTRKGTPGGAGPGTVSVLSTMATDGSLSVSMQKARAVQSISEIGAGHPHENRPPYYVLLFIMKK